MKIKSIISTVFVLLFLAAPASGLAANFTVRGASAVSDDAGNDGTGFFGRLRQRYHYELQNKIREQIQELLRQIQAMQDKNLNGGKR